MTEPDSLLIDPWDGALCETRDLCTHQANWDGEGADPVPPVLIQTVWQLLSDLRDRGTRAPTYVYPLADGTVMIEWHRGRGAVYSANLRHDGRVDVHRFEPDALSVFIVHLTASAAADAVTKEVGP